MFWYCFAAVGGILFGMITTTLYFRMKSTSGTLRIDHSNPAKDVYRFEIDNLDKLNKKRKIVLKIDHHADLS